MSYKIEIQAKISLVSSSVSARVPKSFTVYTNSTGATILGRQRCKLYLLIF